MTNGHTHFFLIGDDAGKKFNWGEEANIKGELAKRIAKGRSKYANSYVCKIIMIVLGDNPSCIPDIKFAEDNCIPIIFLAGSPLCNDVVVKKGGFPGVARNDQDGDGDIEWRDEWADGKI